MDQVSSCVIIKIEWLGYSFIVEVGNVWRDLGRHNRRGALQCYGTKWGSECQMSKRCFHYVNEHVEAPLVKQMRLMAVRQILFDWIIGIFNNYDGPMAQWNAKKIYIFVSLFLSQICSSFLSVAIFFSDCNVSFFFKGRGLFLIFNLCLLALLHLSFFSSLSIFGGRGLKVIC